MKKIFVDTNDFVAVLNKRDQWHERAVEVENLNVNSMNVMREQNITQILTHDEHFEQEGFTILL